MQAFTNLCMKWGWSSYSLLMRYFWVVLAFYYFACASMIILCTNFEHIADYAVEHWGARRYDSDSPAFPAIAIPVRQSEIEGEEPLEIFVHSLGANVYVPSEQMRLSPDDPLTVFVVVLFPLLSSMYLAFFTVGETLVRKRKRLIPGLIGIFALFLPWTIPRYFKKHWRRFYFPFRILSKRDTTAKRRVFLLIFYTLCGIGSILIAFQTRHPAAALFNVWFLGGMGITVYALMFHCMVLCLLNRKSRNCQLNAYRCAAEHICIGTLVFPLFPLLCSFIVYGINSPSILWTIIWLPLVFICVPIAAAGYAATFVAVGVWIARGINRSCKRSAAQ